MTTRRSICGAQVLESLRPDIRPPTQRRNINFLPAEAASAAADDSEAHFGDDAAPFDPCATGRDTTGGFTQHCARAGLRNRYLAWFHSA